MSESNVVETTAAQADAVLHATTAAVVTESSPAAAAPANQPATYTPGMAMPWLPPGHTMVLPGRGEVFYRHHQHADPTAPTLLLLHGWTASADLQFFTAYEALAGAGAASYSELEHRLDGSPLADAAQRNQLVEAAERYRTATAAWQDLAGDIPAPWVVAQQDRLVELAGMRAALQAAPTAGADREQSASAALLAGLMSRAGAIKEVGGGEPLPLFLDDPLAGLQWADKVPVLEFINRLAERQQLVLCTDDLEILQWAKLEAMAGNAEVVDVNPGRAMAAGAGAEPAPSGATGPAAPRTAGGQAS